MRFERALERKKQKKEGKPFYRTKPTHRIKKNNKIKNKKGESEIRTHGTG